MVRVQEWVNDRETTKPSPGYRDWARPAWMTGDGIGHHLSR
jgi:hypothetical protein